MVTVSDFKVVQTEDGDEYIRLILTGDLSFVVSNTTGRHYATVRKCSISATFDEVTAKSMLGKSLPGNIIKEECDEYEYTLENGETITLAHRWTYTNKSSEELAIDELVEEVNSNGTAKVEATA